MNVGKRIRTTVVAPLALGLSFATLAAAQQPPAQTQPASLPPAASGAAASRAAGSRAAGGSGSQATFSGPSASCSCRSSPIRPRPTKGCSTKLKEALAKNEKPERKAMAAGWKVYKSGEPMGGNTLYVHIVDPVASRPGLSRSLQADLRSVPERSAGSLRQDQGRVRAERPWPPEPDARHRRSDSKRIEASS